MPIASGPPYNPHTILSEFVVKDLDEKTKKVNFFYKIANIYSVIVKNC